MYQASAPGKIILFGEHTVVYGRPALAVPVTQVQARAWVSQDLSLTAPWLEAPDIGLSASLKELLEAPEPSPLALAAQSVLQTLGVENPPRLRIRISSSIPLASGLGSGAAVSAALIRALSAALRHPLPDEQVNALVYEVEKIHHGTPSGIDNTVITYARPVYFVRGQPIETFRPAQPFTLLIGDSGIAAPTRQSVGDVRLLWQADPPRWESVFDQAAALARAARQAIEASQPARLGPLMNENHRLLQKMTVSCPALDRLTQAARRAGALGAKLSGGGRGGNMIALVTEQSQAAVRQALLDAGACRVLQTTVGEKP